MSWVSGASSPVDVLPVAVVGLMHASSSEVSDVATLVVPSHFAVLVVNVTSHDSVAISVFITEIVRDRLSSVVEPSGGVSSLVMGEPLALVLWVEGHTSEVFHSSSGVLHDANGETTLHLVSDSEPDSVGSWPSWDVITLSVNIPTLVLSIVASPEDNVSSMSV